MANTTYTIALYASGRHSVSVTGDDPIAVKAGIGWAQGILEGLAAEPERDLDAEEGMDGEAPICAVHQVPMIRQPGKLGKYAAFWSCHQKHDDGSYCSYRPNDDAAS